MAPKDKSRLGDPPPSTFSLKDEQVEESLEEEQQSEKGQEEEFGEENKEHESPTKPITEKTVQPLLKSVQSTSESRIENELGFKFNSDLGHSGKLQVDVSKSQSSDKIRTLKKKFMTSMEYGEVPRFLLVYEYSNQIWGAPSNNVVKENVSSSANGKAKKAVTVVVKKSAEHK
ncbi:hypothetical protein CQW23_32055 [Capsicum baccatum]|uniref:Uncharacterized protein n=1 Tax=Capsicum baccatum TaxID=33114 RepID=A0A2G2V5R9_CAPBA|nr:hypothetical protein CQW23_32055 [Capsicum baccatum]